MSKLATIYTVDRVPRTAAARSTLGYKATPFEVIADTESSAIVKAQRASTYASREFSWIVRGSRVVVLEDEQKDAS